MRALKTLRNILETEFRGVYALKVIDVLKNPQLAEEDKILATPTLAKILPPPVRRIIGDLSDRESITPGTALMQVQKLPTGMEGFDDILHGGLPIGRSTLISGTSGTGKTVFSLNFLHNGIRDFNEPGIFVTFEESPLDILRNAASFGWNLREMVEQDKLFILDASPDPEGQDVAGSFDLSGLIERINYAIRKYKARRVAIDSITAVFQQYDAVSVVRREIFPLMNMVRLPVMESKNLSAIMS